MDIIAIYIEKELKKLAELLKAVGQTDKEILETLQHAVTEATRKLETTGNK